MNIEQLEHIIDRYLSGKATAEEKEFISRWLKERPEDKLPIDANHKVFIKDRLWQVVSNRSTATGESGNARAPMAAGWSRRKSWYRLAAAVAFITVGVLIFYLGQPFNKTVNTQQVSAARGISRIFTLPDSSKVYLFPGATLTVPDNYNEKERNITLAGRAFFEVQHNLSRPFYVQAGALRTRVLGTSFEVITADSLHSTVIVRTGKVAVQYGNRSLATLTANKRLRYDARQNTFVTDEVNAALLCEWWNNGLVYNQVSLQEVVHDLSNWYNTPIEIANHQWRSEPVTIRVKGQNITEVITLLSQTLGFRSRQTGDRIIIY